MQIIQILRQEHSLIRLVLTTMDRLRPQRGKSIPDAGRQLESLLEFLWIYVDHCHCGKEENVLFLAMEKAGSSRQTGPIGIGLAQHQMIRKTLQFLQEVALQWQPDEPQSNLSLAAAMDDYMLQLRAHLDREERVLFPLAEDQLGEHQDARLLQAFHSLEQNLLSPRRRANLLEKLQRLNPEIHF
jgi:hemerythrin-like domain-containing protein